MWRFFGLILLVCCLLACDKRTPAALDNDTNAPVLRLETGMHTAMIRRISVDAAQRFVVTASDDKTARVWDLASGELLQVLRPPLGAGHEGKLFAVALSPDGQEVAVGGFTGKDNSDHYSIYLFDRASGHLSRQIVVPKRVTHLLYSPDGQFLAAGLKHGAGIRLYRRSDLAELGRDSDYGSDNYGLDFDAGGRLVSSCYDGYVRLYAPGLKLLRKVAPTGGQRPFSVRFSPDGQRLAVGFADSTAVQVLSGDDLRLLYAADTAQANNGNLGSVAWSADGQMLYAGGFYNDNGGIRPVLRWDQAGRGKGQGMPASSNTVMDLQPPAAGRVLYGAGDPQWGVLEADGHKGSTQTAGIVDHRQSSPSRLMLNAAASQFSFRADKATRTFDLSNGQWLKQANLTPAKTEATAFSVSDWYNTTDPQFNGQPIALKQYERARSLAIAADEQHFVLGADWSLRYFDQQGKQLWQQAVPGAAWAVNLSADNRLVVAAFSDGTIRWYRTSDGAEQLAFFPHANGRDWVVWTPEGFYDAGGEGETLIGYHLNQGADKEGQFVSTAQLERKFYRRDLIVARLQGDEDKIQQALRAVGDVRQVLAAGLPPELELVSQEQVTTEQGGQTLKLTVRVKAGSGGVGGLGYNLNGVAQSDRGSHMAVEGWAMPIVMEIPLAQGRNVVNVTASSQNGVAAKPLPVTVNVQAPKLVKPTLFVLAVGVSRYQDGSLNLNFADKDALAVGQALRQGGAALFGQTQVVTLTNEQASGANIRRAFAELAGKVRRGDVFVFYLAGHGKVFDGRYYFIPQDAVYRSESAFRSASLDEDTLSQLLASIPAEKSVILLDTCYAGDAAPKVGLNRNNMLAKLERERDGGDRFDERAAVTRLMRATGRAVLAATGRNQKSLEGYQKHGYFTFALLEALSGRADMDKDKQIDVTELQLYLEKRVPVLSKERQFPTQEISPGFRNFPLNATR